MILERPALIVLEGLDATGKSTIARSLAQSLDAELMSTPPSELRGVRTYVDDLYEANGLASQLFYASTVAFASDRARALMAKGRSVQA